ncbi:hypothetical protein EW093_07955 [Thiospirochaeta perfilievii]|uniref:Transporter substrate-binding domain-containing protein n=1 Tax=Thiospirochaeta perfilievii TaxID=252967 RepID=A0A5C1QCI5_9SPIO|nr:hypothetical protein [Thiospirochaeta perfilievii]QEN04639.1 hypothetical protein EW093_07955 [Thiospirochaeta perfilievii]
MKRLFVLLLFCIIFLNSILAVDSLVISTGSKDVLNFKISTAILKEAYSILGLDLSITNTSLPRSIQLSSSGNTDGELCRATVIEALYPTLIRVDVPLLEVNTVAFYLLDSININSWDSLKPYRIAYERGIKVTQESVVGMNVVATDDLDLAFKLLKYGRVDVVISGYYNGLDNLKGSDLMDKIKTSTPLNKVTLYHYLNIKHKDLIPKLEEALNSIDIEGIIKAVLALN